MEKLTSEQRDFVHNRKSFDTCPFCGEKRTHRKIRRFSDGNQREQSFCRNKHRWTSYTQTDTA